MSAADREAFEETVQGDGYSSYQIADWDESGVLVPAPTRLEHYPVYFTEPLLGNEDSLGFDQAS